MSPASAAARTVGSTELQSGVAYWLDCTAAQLTGVRRLSTPPAFSVCPSVGFGASLATTPQKLCGSAAEAPPGASSATSARAKTRKRGIVRFTHPLTDQPRQGFVSTGRKPDYLTGFRPINI